MAKLSLFEVDNSRLNDVTKVDGQIIVVSDTGCVYKDTNNGDIINRAPIGNDVIAVEELPLAPIPNKIYFLKPDKLYTYDTEWVCITNFEGVIRLNNNGLIDDSYISETFATRDDLTNAIDSMDEAISSALGSGVLV